MEITPDRVAELLEGVNLIIGLYGTVYAVLFASILLGTYRQRLARLAEICQRD